MKTPTNSGWRSAGVLALLAAALAVVGAGVLPRSDPGADTASASGAGTTESAIPAEVTFATEIAPILHAECAGCHRDGGSAPFALVTYDDARERADRIARATAARVMPPWLPESDGQTFVGERHLTDRQIELFQQWARDDAPAGAMDQAPSPPPPAPEWRLGTPDLVVDVPTYVLPAEGHDVYRNIVVRIPLDTPRYVTSVELRPGDPRVVHHARMMIDTTASSRLLDEQEEAPGFDGMELRSNAANPEGHFLGWTPGKGALPPQEDMGWKIEPGTDLVLQLHMRTTGKQEQVESQVGFYFTDTPPKHEPVLLLLSSLMIDIPAGDSAYRVTNSYTLPIDVDLLSIYPHAHYLGKDLQGYAVLPGGSKKELIRIPDWDFNWQDDYRFAKPVPLPAGTILNLDFTFDNSAENPHNPSDPPRPVVYGSNSTDEMADLILQVLPRNPAERATLIADAAWQNETEDMAYMARQEFREGRRALTTGDADQAIFHFRETMQYQLDHPGALSGLTQAFLLKGDLDSARLVGERAVEVTQGNDAAALSALAEAYSGLRDGRALGIGERALRVARQSGALLLADSIAARLPAYREIPR